MDRLSRIILVLPLCFLLLSSCTEGQLAANVAKSVPMNGDRQNEGTFKVGRPYKVEGQWYTPEETYTYSETGIASWYGPGFQGRRTASGEVFDMNELTAAHRTLQMPSLVRVTNLGNGRSLVVRVNDRGPFKRGRVIDLSKKAAELLGVTAHGTAKVRLDLLAEESRAIAAAARQGRDTSGVEVAMNENPQARYIEAALPPQVASSDMGMPPVPGHVEAGKFLPDPVVSQFPVTPSSIYVQTGSYTNAANAQAQASALSGFGDAQVHPANIRGQNFYRVRIGPLARVEDADALLSRLFSNGQKQSIVVIE